MLFSSLGVVPHYGHLLSHVPTRSQELIELYWYSCAGNIVYRFINELNDRSAHQLCYLPNSESYNLFVLVLHDLRRNAVASSERFWNLSLRCAIQLIEEEEIWDPCWLASLVSVWLAEDGLSACSEVLEIMVVSSRPGLWTPPEPVGILLVWEPSSMEDWCSTLRLEKGICSLCIGIWPSAEVEWVLSGQSGCKQISVQKSRIKGVL